MTCCDKALRSERKIHWKDILIRFHLRDPCFSWTKLPNLGGTPHSAGCIGMLLSFREQSQQPLLNAASWNIHCSAPEGIFKGSQSPKLNWVHRVSMFLVTEQRTESLRVTPLPHRLLRPEGTPIPISRVAGIWVFSSEQLAGWSPMITRLCFRET